MTEELKLTIELVPAPQWYQSLRRNAKKSVWNRIRTEVIARQEGRCAVCGAPEGSRLQCHEVWEYDEKQLVQRLKGFVGLCTMCHHVKHLGLAGILAEEGKLDYERVVEHFMKVNRCDRATFERHKAEAFAEWRRRNLLKWQLDLGEYAEAFSGLGKGAQSKNGGAQNG